MEKLSNNFMQKKEILIVGVGNPLRNDDGIGPKIIALLRKYENLACDLLDGGTDALALLDIIPNYKKVLLIDAVNMREKPGVLRVFLPDEAKIKIKHDALSTHGFGIAEMLELMKQLEIKTKVLIIGIEPADINFGEKLSDEISAKIPDIIKTIEAIIQQN